MTARWVVSESTETLLASIDSWLEDPDSTVTYAEAVEDRIAVRMTQEAREASTIWWKPDQRSLFADLYMIPAPTKNAEAVYRSVLARNRSLHRCRYSLAEDGSIILQARLPNETVTAGVLDSVIGEMFEQVEIAFRPLVRLAF